MEGATGITYTLLHLALRVARVLLFLIGTYLYVRSGKKICRGKKEGKKNEKNVRTKTLVSLYGRGAEQPKDYTRLRKQTCCA